MGKKMPHFTNSDFSWFRTVETICCTLISTVGVHFLFKGGRDREIPLAVIAVSLRTLRMIIFAFSDNALAFYIANTLGYLGSELLKKLKYTLADQKGAFLEYPLTVLNFDTFSQKVTVSRFGTFSTESEPSMEEYPGCITVTESRNFSRSITEKKHLFKIAFFVLYLICRHTDNIDGLDMPISAESGCF